MRSLKTLCVDPCFPKRQKEYFRAQVDALLVEGGVGKNGALFCLNRLWHHYDVGGHSMGRSLRSVILEKILVWLRVDKETTDDTSIQKAKIILSILVAMYYDFEYINRHDWFDYKLADMWDLPLRDRVLVSAAARALDVDDIPSLDEWDEDRLIAFVHDF
jgi:hypothetical protein